MNRNDFRALCVQPDCTLHDALLRMDQTARGILLVLSEDGRLARTLTDGDLRRARLQQLSDTLTVAALPEQAALKRLSPAPVRRGDACVQGAMD